MKIADCHNDFLTYFKTNQAKKNYLYRVGFTDLKILNAVFWTTNTQNILKNVEKYNKILFKKQNNNIKFLYTLEDVGFLKLEDIKTLKNLKVDFCGLVWNFDNRLGGGSFGLSGLTSLGKQIVFELEKNEIYIDTAHMNEKTFKDFVNISTNPIYNSHSNIYCLHKHARNLKDWQIEKIIKSNGFLGLSFVKDFITGKETFSSIDIAKQIVFFVNKWGSDNLGIGTDFFGTEKLPNDCNCYMKMKNLEKALVSLGLSLNDINKIFYENYYNFLKRINKI